MFLRFSLILFIGINNKFRVSKQFYKPFRILKEERNQRILNEIQYLTAMFLRFSLILFIGINNKFRVLKQFY
jgi:hypothetical protein